MAFKIADLKIGQRLLALSKTTTARTMAGIVVSAFVAHQTSTISFSDALLASTMALIKTVGRYSALKQQEAPLGEENTSRPVEGQ
jgi:hypothetical protein